MAINYFSNFPNINYYNRTIPDITRRTVFLQKLLQDSTLFYPYTIDEGERADVIATWYYGDPSYDWLVYFSNNIIDPYTQWPKTLQQLNNSIIKKYGSIQQAQATVLFYRKYPTTYYISPDGTSTSTQNISGYTSVTENTDIRVTIDTYNALSTNVKANYYAVYAYDYENEQNDNKKNIVLIRATVKDEILKQLKSLLNG